MDRRGFLKTMALTAGGVVIVADADAQDQARRKATIQRSKCVGCGDCVRACPVKAIRLDGGKAVVDKEKCVGCRLCVLTCGYGAPR